MIPLLLAALAGLAPGLAAAFVLWRDNAWLRAELRATTDRLLAARDAGAVIPPRDQPPAPKPDPLPAELVPFVEQWEDPRSRMAQEVEIRQRLAQGWSVARLVRWYRDVPSGDDTGV